MFLVELSLCPWEEEGRAPEIRAAIEWFVASNGAAGPRPERGPPRSFLRGQCTDDPSTLPTYSICETTGVLSVGFVTGARQALSGLIEVPVVGNPRVLGAITPTIEQLHGCPGAIMHCIVDRCHCLVVLV